MERAVARMPTYILTVGQVVEGAPHTMASAVPRSLGFRCCILAGANYVVYEQASGSERCVGPGVCCEDSLSIFKPRRVEIVAVALVASTGSPRGVQHLRNCTR